MKTYKTKTKTVIHSFTPSGVEHTFLAIAEPKNGFVIHSFTPSGVEHTFDSSIKPTP